MSGLSLKITSPKWVLGCLCFLEEKEWKFIVAAIVKDPSAMPPDHGSDAEPPAWLTQVGRYQLKVILIHSCK